MPRERRARSASYDRRCQASPYSSSSLSCDIAKPVESAEDTKEWDEVRCPICIEHPHNAVLLMCSSHDKGCRPFMCDTSYRHSNCLDHYRKAFLGSKLTDGSDNSQQLMKLSCPLCRGLVSGWTIVESARHYMNTKSRSCSMESCNFTGIYGELRKHARNEHPSVRPAEVDPERERDWQRMEQQRDLGDLFSMFRSATTEEVDDVIDDDIEDASGRLSSFPPITVLFVVHWRQTAAGAGQQAQPLSSSSRNSRGTRSSRRGRMLLVWGESLSNRRYIGGVIDDGTNGDNHTNNGSEVVNADSQQSQARRRRQYRMSDDECDDI